MSENATEGCACGAAPKLIFPCSGAADVGEIADRAARRLTREGAGRMYCLAGIGGRVNDIVVNTQAAGKILAIDGCPKACARHTLEHAGFKDFAHLRLSDIGFAKGASPANEESVSIAVEHAKPLLAC